MGMNSNIFDQILSQQQPQPPQQETPKKNVFDDVMQSSEKQQGLWDEFMDMIFSKEESAFEKGLGQTVRAAGSAIAGTPGNIAHLLGAGSEALQGGLNKLTGVDTGPSSSTKFLKSIPGSEDIKEMFDLLTSNQYKPQNELEAKMQEGVEDMASLLSGGTGFLKSLVVTAGGALSKLASEELGFENLGDKTKMATQFVLGMFNPKGAQKFMQNSYNKAEKLIPQNAAISSANFEKQAKDLYAELKKGIASVPSKAPVAQSVKDMYKNAKNGQIDIRDLMEARRNLNEKRTSLVFDPIYKGKEVKKSLAKNFEKAMDVIDNTLNEYAKTNPQAMKYYRQANDAYRGIAQSRQVSDAISRMTKKYGKHMIAPLGVEAVLAPASMGYLATGLGTGYGLLKGGEFVHRLTMNPTLRKYYIESMTAAINQQSAQYIRSANKLAKEMEKEGLIDVKHPAENKK